MRAVFISAALLAGGCEFSDPVEFKLNMEGRSPDEVGLAQKQAIAEALEELFGTPDEPKVLPGTGLEPERMKMAAGPMGRDWDKNKRGLYRQHCAVCHGISGDGAGPLATTFDPYPRDFRAGVFKYTSTRSGAKPLRENLKRTLLGGISGTGMPSFIKLSEREIDALVEYVKYLSIRGQTETYLFQLVVDEDEYLPLGVNAMEQIIEEAVLWVAELWAEPERNPKEYMITPPPRPPVGTPKLLAAAIARGKELYASEDAKCVECHGPEGAGDGENTDLYDDWNKPKKGVKPEQTEALASLYTLPIQRLRARDFREGNFRGGSSPEDLYLRAYIGIKGTPMPGVGPSPGVEGVCTPEEIWDVVRYILSLSERK